MTIAAVRNLTSYNWSDWGIGIMRSFLSGGAAALITLSSGAVVGYTGEKLWTQTGSAFLLMGLYRLGEFLQLHGAPDKLQQALSNAAEQASKTVDAVQEAKATAPEKP